MKAPCVRSCGRRNGYRVVDAEQRSTANSRQAGDKNVSGSQGSQDRHHAIRLGGASRAAAHAQEMEHAPGSGANSPGRLVAGSPRQPRQRRHRRGRVDLAHVLFAEDKGYRVVGDPIHGIYYLQNTLETTRSYVRKNREQVIKFLRGYIEGIAYFKKNKKESLDIMGKKLRIQSLRNATCAIWRCPIIS